MNTVKVYPGMMCNSVEFFVHENDLKFIQHGTVKDFTELPFATIAILKEEIDNNNDVKLALHDMHPNSDIKRTEQFAKCRFGGLDFCPDINSNILQDGEYWPCPNHGNCPHEGVLCKLPKFNETRLTKTDVQLMQLSSSEKTNEVIAEEMNLPLGTFHKAKKYIHELLEVQTKQGIAQICIFFNLI